MGHDQVIAAIKKTVLGPPNFCQYISVVVVVVWPTCVWINIWLIIFTSCTASIALQESSFGFLRTPVLGESYSNTHLFKTAKFLFHSLSISASQGSQTAMLHHRTHSASKLWSTLLKASDNIFCNEIFNCFKLWSQMWAYLLLYMVGGWGQISCVNANLWEKKVASLFLF